MRIVLVGGGTGGHFYPLMATAEQLQAIQNPVELYYMGPDPYSEADLQSRNIQFVSCPAGRQRKYKSVQNFFDLFRVIRGVFVATRKLFSLYPDVVLSKGGFTSVPVIIAARLLRIPIVIHESDAKIGRANAIAVKAARYIGVAYDDTAALLPNEKTALIGIPIREALLTEPAGEPRSELGIEGDLPLIVVLGGSSGAERVNTLILESLDELLPEYQIIHQTGDAHHRGVTETARAKIVDENLLKRYRPVSSLDAETLNVALHAADIVISRAGSTTIHEVAVHGTPAVLIPIPEDISHDQRSNAYAYARTGAAIVLEEQNLSDGLLTAELERIMSNDALYDSMVTAARQFAIPDGASKLAKIVQSIGKEHE